MTAPTLRGGKISEERKDLCVLGKGALKTRKRPLQWPFLGRKEVLWSPSGRRVERTHLLARASGFSRTAPGSTGSRQNRTKGMHPALWWALRDTTESTELFREIEPCCVTSRYERHADQDFSGAGGETTSALVISFLAQTIGKHRD